MPTKAKVEEKTGTILPCNVIVQEKCYGIEVSASPPRAGIERIGNTGLTTIANDVASKLKRVMDAI